MPRLSADQYTHVQCSQCGKEIRRPPSAVKGRANITCSNECRLAFARSGKVKVVPANSSALDPNAPALDAKVAAMVAADRNGGQIKRELGITHGYLVASLKRQNIKIRRNAGRSAADGNTKKADITSVQCHFCGKSKDLLPWQLKGRKQFYCDRSCLRQAERHEKDASGNWVPKVFERTCPACNKVFPVRSLGITSTCCSYECSVIHRTKSEPRPCIVCGKVYMPRGPDSSQQYCSKPCKGVSMNNDVLKTCVRCGKEKMMPASQVKAKRTFCSQACTFAYRDENPEFRREWRALLTQGLKTKWQDPVWSALKKAALSKRAAQMIAEGQKKETRIEIAFEQLLLRLGLAFEKQKIVYSAENRQHKVYDFWLQDSDTYIELHGRFWHADPRYYKADALRQVQEANVANDAVKRDIVEKELGRHLLVFWEDDILQCPEAIEMRLSNL